MLPNGFKDTLIVDEKTMENTRTYKLDLNLNRIYDSVDGLEALKQSLYKRLITPKNAYMIYQDTSYGCDIRALINDSLVTPELLEMEINRAIPECLLEDDRVTKVTDLKYNVQGKNVYIEVWINTIYGDTKLEGVI